MNQSTSASGAPAESSSRIAFEAHFQRTRRMSAPPVRSGEGYRDECAQDAWLDWRAGVAASAGVVVGRALDDANRYQSLKKHAFNRTVAGFDGPVLQWTLTIPASQSDDSSLDAAIDEVSDYHGDKPHYVAAPPAPRKEKQEPEHRADFELALKGNNLKRFHEVSHASYVDALIQGMWKGWLRKAQFDAQHAK